MKPVARRNTFMFPIRVEILKLRKPVLQTEVCLKVELPAFMISPSKEMYSQCCWSWVSWISFVIYQHGPQV